MITSTFYTIIRDCILFLLNTLLAILSEFARSVQQSSAVETSDQRLLRLQAARSALLLQQEDVLRKLREIAAEIDQLSQPNSTSQLLGAVPLDTAQPEQPQVTPPRVRPRHTRRPSSIGCPYRRPFDPPRTPEEVRQNNIIEWINDLRNTNHY
jgi:hypothetical protein